MTDKPTVSMKMTLPETAIIIAALKDRVSVLARELPAIQHPSERAKVTAHINETNKLLVKFTS